MRTLVIAKILLKNLINICEFLKIVLSLLHYNHSRLRNAEAHCKME